MSEQHYYLRTRGKVIGPFPLERMHIMKERGQLGRTHQISSDRVTWSTAGSIPELFPTEFEAVGVEPQVEAASVVTAEVAFAAHPVSEASGPAIAVAWFYHVAGQQFGPVSAMEIRRLLSAGELVGTDMVWREGLDNWCPINDVPELRPTQPANLGGNAAAGFGGIGRPRRSAAAVTALCAAIAPWPLYGLSMLMILLSLNSKLQQAPTFNQLIHYVSGTLVLSLILNLCWFLLSVLGIVFGGIAMSQISTPEKRLTGYEMAISGLVLGIVNILILFVWIPLSTML